MTDRRDVRLERTLAPLARRIVNRRNVERARLIDQALTGDGKLQPGALQLLGNLLQDGLLDDTTRSTSSTSVWVDQVILTVPLEPGTWQMRIQGDLRAGNDAGANVDTRLLVNNQQVSAVTASGPTVSASPFYLFAIVTDVDGSSEVNIRLQFKSDTTGLSVVRDGRLVVDALRTS